MSTQTRSTQKSSTQTAPLQTGSTQTSPNHRRFHGSIPALVTPFRNNEIDRNALTKLVRFHLDAGSNGIVAVGTTGESSTLSHDEHQSVIEMVCHQVGGQIPVIAGVGSNNPVEAIQAARTSHKSGAGALLHVAGYYNRPNAEGIYQQFKALNDATDLPIFVYNVPARAVVDILPEAMARIASLPNIIGVKDATNDLTRPLRERQLINKEFYFLSGEDGTAVAYNANGGVGCISVTANVAPSLCSSMQADCANNDFDSALKIQQRLMPLHQALFLEPSPAGVKYAYALLGLCEADCRLPMVELTEQTKQAIQKAMKNIG